eukprot:NODE_1715_length_779_cov_125.876712_g1433_i0.p2 GENE.NODE_1715_length_779_cov_125.876712_g1433_i0~~NODE_1715_length_779_cov_125.876712_g1433_i0.p2  ORF type:complete len:175 (+),score=6.41 NODE_1715_length_779_cov_125.876712_g1433_i0:57-581(+)
MYSTAKIRPPEEAAAARNMWGNYQDRNSLKPVLANLYLKALKPDSDVDVHAGVGKPSGNPALKMVHPDDMTPADTAVMANLPHPYAPKLPPEAPPHICGYTGHRTGAQDQIGVSFNKIEESRHPDYAGSVHGTYESHKDAPDRIPNPSAATLLFGIRPVDQSDLSPSRGGTRKG